MDQNDINFSPVRGGGILPSSWLSPLEYKGSKEKFAVTDCVLKKEGSHFSHVHEYNDGRSYFYIDIV
jgi:hypothetical protein